MKENVIPEITIRKADRADLPALLKLYQQLESTLLHYPLWLLSFLSDFESSQSKDAHFRQEQVE